MQVLPVGLVITVPFFRTRGFGTLAGVFVAGTVGGVVIAGTVGGVVVAGTVGGVVVAGIIIYDIAILCLLIDDTMVG